PTSMESLAGVGMRYAEARTSNERAEERPDDRPVVRCRGGVHEWTRPAGGPGLSRSEVPTLLHEADRHAPCPPSLPRRHHRPRREVVSALLPLLRRHGRTPGRTRDLCGFIDD